MLSPLPLFPTSFMPSFQSPEPIFGMPCSPNCRLFSIALMQCLYIVSTFSPCTYLSYFSSWPCSNIGPVRYGVSISRILVSPVNLIYSSVTNTSHSKSSENLVLIPLSVSSCHQCSTSPSSN